MSSDVAKGRSAAAAGFQPSCIAVPLTVGAWRVNGVKSAGGKREGRGRLTHISTTRTGNCAQSASWVALTMTR